MKKMHVTLFSGIHAFFKKIFKQIYQLKLNTFILNELQHKLYLKSDIYRENTLIENDNFFMRLAYFTFYWPAILKLWLIQPTERD